MFSAGTPAVNRLAFSASPCVACNEPMYQCGFTRPGWRANPCRYMSTGGSTAGITCLCRGHGVAAARKDGTPAVVGARCAAVHVELKVSAACECGALHCARCAVHRATVHKLPGDSFCGGWLLPGPQATRVRSAHGCAAAAGPYRIASLLVPARTNTGACTCKLDCGRQEEEGHGQELHCANTAPAHGHGDGASGASRATSFMRGAC
eukprot:scaffold74834_cov72-Phaeocystis_antarctica.AAC.2